MAAASSSTAAAGSPYRSRFGDTTQTKVFVGGLAWETPSEGLRQHFEQYGDILEAVVITDRLTGRSKGYGFVTFRDAEAARRAVQDPNPTITGRRANCNIASLGPPRPAQAPRGNDELSSAAALPLRPDVWAGGVAHSASATALPSTVPGVRADSVSEGGGTTLAGAADRRPAVRAAPGRGADAGLLRAAAFSPAQLRAAAAPSRGVLHAASQPGRLANSWGPGLLCSLPCSSGNEPKQRPPGCLKASSISSNAGKGDSDLIRNTFRADCFFSWGWEKTMWLIN